MALRPPKECHDAPFHIVEIDPLKSLMVKIDLIEGWLSPVNSVKVPDEPLEPLVRLVLHEVPVEALVNIPFIPLAELPAHEEELFPGMAVHEPVEHSQIRKLLPHVPGHLVQ